MHTLVSQNWQSRLAPGWFGASGISNTVVSIGFAILVLLWGRHAYGVTLYDGALHSLPEAQGWVYAEWPSGTTVRGVAGGVSSLDTTALAPTMAGYFSSVPLGGAHPDLPVLNRARGFTVSFTMQLLAETHSSDDRAGFSVIITSADFLGLELGFWADEIWAQHDTPLFTHAEGVAFDTTQDLLTYTVAMQDSSYTLFANGAAILSGALRDYRALVGPLSFPYHTSSFLFFGDDTTSASAKVHLASITTTPEPATVWLVASSLVILLLARCRRWLSLSVR
jgi:hypothetical protein